MSLSIQTNVAALIAQNNIRVNSNFQQNTIDQLSSGYRINSSADDAAGLAVANTYRGNTAELTQGVLNANEAVGGLQIVDGGLNNISNILDRLRTLATESASSTFQGDRATLNNEYQGLLSEIDRQAANINLNTGGSYNTRLVTYIGGGHTAADGQVTVDLSGTNSAVDASGLGIANTSIEGGGASLSGNSVRLDDPAASFLAGNSQDLTFHVSGPNGNQDVTVTVAGGSSGLTGQQVLDNLNSQISSYGISASISSGGTLQFSGSTAFSVSVGTATGGNAIATASSTAVNTANYNLDASSANGTHGSFVPFTAGGGTSASETIVFQNAGSTKTITLDSTNASTLTQALSTLNTSLQGTGIYAVKAADGTDVSLQSVNAFSVEETAYTAGAGGGAGNLIGGVGAVDVTGPAAASSSTGGAVSALSLLQAAVENLGLVQGAVGAGINRLNYSVDLAQSQITNFSAADSSIRDADVAAEAANLTKAQVLEQASLAALAQANATPQAVLSLLKGQ